MTAAPARPPVVAVLNSNDDTVEMLRMMMESEGMLTVSAHVADIRRGVFDFGGFLTEHNPQVIIFDVAPPYDRSWLMLQHLRGVPAAANKQWVITSTNPQRLKEIAHPEEPVYEIIGKPYDLRVIVDVVKKAMDG
jgi:DNA-binding NarL/FixJ family response regulator